MGIPRIPQAFYGTVTIDGEPAPEGTVVRAIGPWIMEDSWGGNPFVLREEGKLGGDGGFDPKMCLQDQHGQGEIGWFYFVVGQRVAQYRAPNDEWRYARFFESGEVTEIELRV